MRKKGIVFILCLVFLILCTNKSIYASNESTKKDLEEGYYVIESALDEGKALDLNGISKKNEENIQLWSKNEGSNQIFEVVYNKDGTYTIKSAFSGKVFDLAWAGTKNGTNVQVYDGSNVNWQKWQIEKTLDNYYQIKSVHNGLVLDINNNQTSDGTNVEVYEQNGGKNQKFKFKKVNLPSNYSELKNGYYQIKYDKNKVVDILGADKNDKTLAGLWDNKKSANQRFKVSLKDNGFYSIVNVKSNLYLEADGVRARQRIKDNSTIAQDWIITQNEDGTYCLVTRCGGLYLTYKENDGLVFSKKVDSENQKFDLAKDAPLVGKKSIEDGYYVIKSAIDNTKVIDIDNASIKSEANAILWQQSNRNNQKFKFEYDGNGYYKITSVRSKKSLDVAWAGQENESNVQQYASSNCEWQKWIVNENDDGTISLISAHSGLYIDLPYAKTDNGTNIQLYMGDNGKNQKFVLEKTSGVEGIKTISDGYYKIQTLNSNQVLDVNDFSKSSHTKIGIWSSNNGYNQRFKITYRENGFYTIVAAHSNKAVNVTSEEDGIEQDDLNYKEEQEWAIKEGKNGKYYIVSAHNGLTLNVDGDGSEGDKITLAEKENLEKQLFTFKSVEVEKGEQTIPNGTYQIVTKLDNNKVLDIQGASSENGANLDIWTNNKQNNQKFNVKYQGNGYYKIIAVNSGKALGVEEAGNTNLVNVRQYDVSDSLKQDWIIKYVEDGYVRIISACNGLSLDVNGESSKDGTNVGVYTKKNNSAQKFKLVKPFEFTSGTYGSTGLREKGDIAGNALHYYKLGSGPNVYFATFAVHGFEDGWDQDGKVLTDIAEDFKNRLLGMKDDDLFNKWTIYIFPSVNPDGEYHGWTNNGPGRTSLYSMAPGNKGIDINRCWSTGFVRKTDNRNYNGTEPFQSYEARALREFLLNRKSQNGQTILVDLHGWLNETIGDDQIGWYYRSRYGMSKHIGTYGQGYLVNWARSNLGSNGRTARSSLVELPEYDKDSSKYINATIDMLRNIN